PSQHLNTLSNSITNNQAASIEQRKAKLQALITCQAPTKPMDTAFLCLVVGGMPLGYEVAHLMTKTATQCLGSAYLPPRLEYSSSIGFRLGFVYNFVMALVASRGSNC